MDEKSVYILVHPNDDGVYDSYNKTCQNCLQYGVSLSKLFNHQGKLLTINTSEEVVKI